MTGGGDMLIKYRREKGSWVETREDDACWVRAINPNEDELGWLSARYKIAPAYLKAALDDYELPRYESEDGYGIFYLSTGRQAEDAHWKVTTVGIAVTSEATVTISGHETELVEDFASAPVKPMGESCGPQLMLQLLMRATELFLRDLRLIERKNTELEKKLGIAMKNSLIFEFLANEKSLVYMRTAVNGNLMALEKLRTSPIFKDDAELMRLMDDIVVESRQASDMAGIYSDIMGSSMDAFASIINNNLNVVMKFLTSLTLVLAIPTIVTAFFSMNVPMRWASGDGAFALVAGLAVGLTLIAVLIMRRLRLL